MLKLKFHLLSFTLRTTSIHYKVARKVAVIAGGKNVCPEYRVRSFVVLHGMILGIKQFNQAVDAKLCNKIKTLFW